MNEIISQNGREPLGAAKSVEAGQILNVVIVNDDPTQLAIFAGLLRKQGYETHTYASAGEALAALSKPPAPNLIITDLYMPGIDGWRLCWLLRSPDYAPLNHTPILVTSATFAGREPVNLTAGLGPNAFLPVPADGAPFLELERTAIQGGKLPPPSHA